MDGNDVKKDDENVGDRSIYIRRVIVSNYSVFKVVYIIIFLIITIIIIFRNISCRINISGYIDIIIFSTSACIRPTTHRGSRPRRATLKQEPLSLLFSSTLIVRLTSLDTFTLSVSVHVAP